ncbi:MAG: rRNA maturation RNase YbeY [Bacteroidetes bacterium]|nr:rRNA maturation RNase YbeY [Bacteroidota bacterium]
MKAEREDYWPDPLGLLPDSAVVIGNEHSHLELDTDLVEKLVDQVLEGEQKRVRRLDIILTHAQQLRSLNREWKDADYHTDVLSFSLGHGPMIDGEVYVSLDFAEQHCQDYGATFTQEACRYIVHGVLHLLGYRDSTSEEQKIMRTKEDEYLRRTGITDI